MVAQPKLTARLHDGVLHALDLVKSVSTDNYIVPEETEHTSHALPETEPYTTPSKQPSLAADNPHRQTQPYASTQIHTSSTSSNSTPPYDFSMWHFTNFIDMQFNWDNPTGSPIENSSPLKPHHGLESISFSRSLVEVTLSQACLYLNGDISIPSQDHERAFGAALRLHTRNQLLTYFRWMLGPGRTQMYQAAGLDWDASQNTAYNPEYAETAYNMPNQQLQPQLLTAQGVQQLIESLGAQVLSSDTMELQIRTTINPDSASELHSSPSTHSFSGASTAMTVQLNIARLAANLAYTAMCFEKGPVYPRPEVARAVQASVILASGG